MLSFLLFWGFAFFSGSRSAIETLMEKFSVRIPRIKGLDQDGKAADHQPGKRFPVVGYTLNRLPFDFNRAVGTPHSNRIGMRRAHHDAFDDRLAAYQDIFRRRFGFCIRHQISQDLDGFASLSKPYRLWKRSIRPAVSISFCFPVKNGWQAEHISSRDFRFGRAGLKLVSAGAGYQYFVVFGMNSFFHFNLFVRAHSY